jgi:putative FmdB family regulatory protein
MPRYDYYCEECDEYFEIIHSMTESLENCQECNSLAFNRIPSMPAYIQKKRAAKIDKKTGSLVEEYIKMNRESVKEEKNKLKRQEYKNE